MNRMIVNAVIGAGFKDTKQALEMEEKGLAEFCGNQHNEDWKWRSSELEKLSDEEVINLYNYITGDRVDVPWS